MSNFPLHKVLFLLSEKEIKPKVNKVILLISKMSIHIVIISYHELFYLQQSCGEPLIAAVC